MTKKTTTPHVTVNETPVTIIEPTTPVSPVVTVGDWVLTLFLMIIPIVNIVLLLMWAFGRSINPSKSNWAKAALIWLVIGLVLSLIFSTAIMGYMSKMYHVRC